jgi:GH15 family glucan-1,4-alpha-glucosidase
MDGGYKPLEEYGIIGNLETCALVGTDGAIDWCCLPQFDSSSVFGAILDPDTGGRFAIHPTEPYESHQQYMNRTNVLQTTFETDSGTVTVTDFMPVLEGDTQDEPGVRALYRKVTCTEGSVEMETEFAPRFDYARSETTVEPVTDGVFATGENRHLYLGGADDFETDGNEAHATYELDEYDDRWFVLQYTHRTPMTPEQCERLLDRTVDYWREWAHSCAEDDCIFAGQAHDLIERSELVLKLLNYRDTGALIAAPTTSLPEEIGGVRNWDYRFSWIRDGGITVRAFTNLNHFEEADEYMRRFLKHTKEGDSAQVQPLYGIDRSTDLEEEELDHLRGYRDSRPVRIGNEAADQQQLDVYGDLVLAFYQQYWSDGETVAEEDWDAIRSIADYVCDHWGEKDVGIWELRGEPQHLVHSKVMCWIALDRSIDMAQREDLEAPLDHWRECRSDIEEAVLERGFDEELGSFTQSFDGTELDASALLVVLSGILPFDDPRVVGTVEAIRDRLETHDGLVYRYEDDDLPGEEGAFVFCSFWLVNALTAIGRVDEARDVFESVVEYASPLGLFAEEIDPETGRQLGNFPQAFSHIGLVNSALYLKEADADWATADKLGEPTLVQESDTEGPVVE